MAVSQDESSQRETAAWKRRTISVLLWAESHLLPLLFLALAAHTSWGFLRPLEQPLLGDAKTMLEVGGELARQLWHPAERAKGATPWLLILAFLHNLVRPALLVIFDLLCAYLIAFRKRLQYRPTSLREVLIPIGGTFSMALLPLSVHLPDWATAPLSFPSAGGPCCCCWASR